jgi:hypothetical protein
VIYSRFILATGAIVSTFEIPDAEDPADHLDAGEGAYLGRWPGDAWYITDPTGVPLHLARPASSAAYSGAAILDNNGTDTGTVTPIGSTAVVTITGADFTGHEYLLSTYDPWGADNTLDLTSTVPGDYIVRIVKFPDLDKEIRIPVREL